MESSTDQEQRASLRAGDLRAREIAAAVTGAHAADSSALQSGQIVQESLFWFSGDVAQRATITWSGRFRLGA